MRKQVIGPRAPEVELHTPYRGDFVIPVTGKFHIPEKDGYVFSGVDFATSDSLTAYEFAMCDRHGKWHVFSLHHP